MCQELTSSPQGHQIPVFLLKTKSSPTDAYEDLFSTPQDGFRFEPAFIPVLQHRCEQDGMRSVERLLLERRINDSDAADYGGLIFTSQRAVEAFSRLVEQHAAQAVQKDSIQGWPHLQGIPIYSVGPATTRALRAIEQIPPLQIFGEHTGNGDALAQYILEHYGQWYRDRPVKPPLLFLVGEQRRDVIPRTLMDDALPTGARIEVTETVVYGTGVMESFPSDLRQALSRTRDSPTRWVVVFSPAGCDSMLATLRDVADTARTTKAATYIATIGPTTRDYLTKTFGVVPDVCASTPSPEGIWQAITIFEKQRKNLNTAIPR
ncbi:uroporphyrinogen-III synthase [Xylariaceae sp. FL0594]|nr:uroporphyrinogen-III synthase [Xylariaceae sp. FL0594]